MASIKIPTPLRAYTGGEAKVNVSGETVGAVLNNLIGEYPDLEQHLFNNGELRSFVNVFVGNEDIRTLNGLETPIDADTDLRIIPSIAGGHS
ncbi:MAG: MoaD/ThiS family protein [Chloroflexota bacterium]